MDYFPEYAMPFANGERWPIYLLITGAVLLMIVISACVVRKCCLSKRIKNAATTGASIGAPGIV